MTESVIFDLDGTLIDSAPSIRDAVNAMLADEGLAPLSLPEVIGFVGDGLPVLVTRVMAARGLTVERAADIQAQVLRYYQNFSLQGIHFYPGALAALEVLAATGLRLGLCTNKPIALARAILVHSGTGHLFGAVVGGDTLPQRKPDPAPLRATVEQLGSVRAIFVGDSEIDAETADRAALPFLLFRGGYAKRPHELITATARFDDYAALPALVAHQMLSASL